MLNDDEIAALWSATDTLSQPFRDSIRLLILTGARLNEVAAMTWGEIDPAARLWRLPKERSKNRQAHVVPLSDMAISHSCGAAPHSKGGGFRLHIDGQAAAQKFYTPQEQNLMRQCQACRIWTFHDLTENMRQQAWPGSARRRT